MARIVRILCHGCGEIFTAYAKGSKFNKSIRMIADCNLHKQKQKKRGNDAN